MKYTITLERMEFRAYHGCYDLEQQVGNRFTVDLQLVTELGRVAEEDSVEIAVNYLTVYEVVREVMGHTQRTIERVAMNIIEAVKEHKLTGQHLRKLRSGITRISGNRAKTQSKYRRKHGTEYFPCEIIVAR